MKNIKLVFCGFIIVFFVVFSTYSQSLSLGVKGGAVFSKHVSNLNEEVTKNVTWWTAGGFVNYRISRNFTMGTELNYIIKGTTLLANTSQNTFDNVETKLTYASIPLIFKFGVKLNDIYPYVFTGPRIDINVQNDENGLLGFYKNRKDANWGIIGGIGLIFNTDDNPLLGIELRYNRDFTPFTSGGYTYKGFSTVFPADTDFLNQSFEITVFLGKTIFKKNTTKRNIK